MPDHFPKRTNKAARGPISPDGTDGWQIVSSCLICIYLTPVLKPCQTRASCGPGSRSRNVSLELVALWAFLLVRWQSALNAHWRRASRVRLPADWLTAFVVVSLFGGWEALKLRLQLGREDPGLLLERRHTAFNMHKTFFFSFWVSSYRLSTQYHLFL